MTIEEQFKKIRPVLGRNVDKLWLSYLAADEKGKREIENLLPLLVEKALKTGYANDEIILVPPIKEQATGEYYIGEVVYGKKEVYPFGLRENEWIQHISIFGRSGSGKTNLVYQILWNFMLVQKPFLVFDWKRNYRDMMEADQDLMVFTIAREISPFKFNPLIPPPGAHPETWLKKLVEVIAHAYFLGEGVIYLLHKIIDGLYKEYGVYDGSNRYPTMNEVLDCLLKLKTKGRETLWLTSTVRAIYSLCFGEIGKVFCTQEQNHLETILKKNVIFELDALTNTDKIFFIESLLLWIYHYRMAEGQRERFKHAIIVEEAHHILLRQKQEAKGAETITDIILREIREFGESMIIIDQHPSLISLPALGNSFCTITMNLKHRNDINLMDDALLLTNKDSINRLPVGYSIVKLQGRYFEPFLVKIPLFSIHKGIITDEDIRKRMGSYFAKSNVISEPEQIPQAISPIPERDKGTDDTLPLLVDIVNNPFSSVVERYARLKLNSRKGNQLMRQLIEQGMVKPVDIVNRNGRLRLFDIEDAGISCLNSAGVDVQNSKREGGIEHRYWRCKIAEHLRARGYQATEEEPIDNGKTVDIMARKEGRTLAFEIETGKSDPLANVKKCVEKGYEIYVLATRTSVFMKIKNRLAGVHHKVKVMPVVTLFSLSL